MQVASCGFSYDSLCTIYIDIFIGGGTCFQVGGYYEVIAYSYCKIMQDNSGHAL